MCLGRMDNTRMRLWYDYHVCVIEEDLYIVMSFRVARVGVVRAQRPGFSDDERSF
jgi:hypothetical protein